MLGFVYVQPKAVCSYSYINVATRWLYVQSTVHGSVFSVDPMLQCILLYQCSGTSQSTITDTIECTDSYIIVTLFVIAVIPTFEELQTA
jgi:hypothetical protein